MDDWSGLRTALVIVAWITVAGGVLLAILWTAFGGVKAVDPNDQLMADAGVPVDPEASQVTSFSSPQIGIHGLMALLTASLITYAAVRSTDRDDGYLAGLLALVVTGIPGILMFRKWRRGDRPHAVAGAAIGRHRVEDRLPRALVYLHGAAALSTVVIITLLLTVD